jgi:TRAP-type mannitol/chloroaromatic compound transport system permease large subunit
MVGVLCESKPPISRYFQPRAVHGSRGQAVFKAPLSSIYPGLMPFIACAIAALAVVTYVPQLSLWILRLV